MDKWQFKGGRKGSNKHAVAGQSWVLERGYGNVEVTWAKENSSETVTHKLTAHRYRQVWTNKPIGKAQRDSVGDIAEGDNDMQVPGSPIIWHVLGDKRKAVGDSSDPFEPISPGNESSGARSNGSPGLANLAPSLSTIVADIAAAAQQSSSDRAALTSSRHGAGGVASLTAAVAAARKQTVGRGGGATSPYGSSKRPRLDDGDSASGRNPLPTSAARLPASSIEGRCRSHASRSGTGRRSTGRSACAGDWPRWPGRAGAIVSAATVGDGGVRCASAVTTVAAAVCAPCD